MENKNMESKNMENKTETTADKYAGFTWQLAAVDVIPVIVFAINCILISIKVSNLVFWVGAVLCVLAGLSKVIWKFIVALTRKDIRIMSMQLRFLMPTGMILIIIGLIMAKVNLIKVITGMPQMVFFVMCFLCICGMVFCAFHDSRSDAKSNWKEQIINSAAQICLMIGLLVM